MGATRATVARRVAAVLALGIIPVVALALVVFPAILTAERLPHPMAVHWGISGAPNGSAASIYGSTLPLWALGTLFLAIGTFAGRKVEEAKVNPLMITAALTAAGYFMYALGAGITNLTIQANLDAPSWTEAHPVGSMIPVFALASGAAILGVALTAVQALGRDRPITTTPVLPPSAPV